MFELIILLIVGTIVISFVQGVQRGEVTPEERKNNPTLLEGFGNFVEELDAQTSKRHTQLKYEAEHCTWFISFESSVSSALKHAQFMDETYREFDCDPETRELFNQAWAKIEDSVGETPTEPIVEPQWARSGPPPPPNNATELAETKLKQAVYDRYLMQHEKLISETQEKLLHQPDLRKYFREALTKMGLEILVSSYFPEAIASKHENKVALSSETGSKSISAVLPQGRTKERADIVCDVSANGTD